jgi:filamentous hemagglutinin
MLGSSGTGADGTLTLRAPRTGDQLGVDIQLPTSGTVVADSHNPIVVEGFQCYGTCSAASRSQPASSLTLLDLAPGSPPTPGSLDVSLNGTLFSDAMTFVGNGNGGLLAANLAKGFSNDFGSSAPVQVQVRPGIEIDSTGDIVVGDASTTTVWDLDSWNAALGAPVNLTLRAGGNLVFNASLSDGFTNNGGSIATWTYGGSGAAVDLAMNSIATGVTGTYRLTAGADLSAADPLAVIPQSITTASAAGAPNEGNVILTPGNLIRTGDGSIAIGAGGDVLLGYSYTGYDSNGDLQVSEQDPLSSVIYTAGVPSVLTPTQSQLFQAPNFGQAAYPTMGGNITVAAADDIRSAPSSQLVSDWLWRAGVVTAGALANTSQTTWTVIFSDFSQGIGALGGGNLTLNAGGDVVNVSAVIPTTGRLLGAAGSVPSAANLILDGGGQLTVQAGGDIKSGVYEDDWGNASVNAGGALTSGTTLATELTGLDLSKLPSSVDPASPIYPVLLLGSGTFDASARDGVDINFVGNSTTLPEAELNVKQSRPASSYFFYTYAPESTVNITSSGGDVVLDNQINNLPIGILTHTLQGLPQLYSPAVYAVVYPGTLSVAALSGDIDILEYGPGGDPVVGNGPSIQGINLFPSASGNLSLLAQGYITGSTTRDLSSTFGITMNETDPALWPSVTSPGSSAAILPAADLPSVPLHENDPQPIYIVANTGSISAGNLTFPKAADVIAGGDIADLTYTGKNLNPSDVTLIEAGGRITYSTPADPVTNELQADVEGITLGGPGYLEVLAGGTLDLGDSKGIVTSGSLADTRLPSTGATLVVGAGFGSNISGTLRQPDYQAFTNTYLAPATSGAPGPYASELIAYMQQLYPSTDANLSYAAALTAFNGLTAAQRLPLLAQVLNNELSATGLAHTLQGANYDRGYTAINTLFPTTDTQGGALTYQGDINMFFSQIKTEQGGSINLLDPGGSVDVGVPNPPAELTLLKQGGTPFVGAAANLGLLVLGEGSIEGFADQNFDVNTSRILTLEGGDIILWASNGNIDAGRGAKSASGAPPPVVQTDANGNVFVNPINDVSGSGIGQLLTGPGETAGLVNLIAPRGDVNAGDAGIRVAGNLNIAAVQVIGANNITVGGTATGVPVSEAGALSGALSGANSLADASKNAIDQLTQDLGSAANFQQLTDSLQPTFIVVKLFCLGLDCKQ